jgi:hypothetical protein
VRVVFWTILTPVLVVTLLPVVGSTLQLVPAGVEIDPPPETKFIIPKEPARGAWVCAGKLLAVNVTVDAPPVVPAPAVGNKVPPAPASTQSTKFGVLNVVDPFPFPVAKNVRDLGPVAVAVLLMVMVLVEMLKIVVPA